MPLLLRLTLSFAGVLATLLLGLGLSLYHVIERDLQGDFVRDLGAAARLQAHLSRQPNGSVSLVRMPGLQIGLSEPESYLLSAEGKLLARLSDAPPPVIPAEWLRRARAGETVIVLEGEQREGWQSVLRPRLTVHTRVALERVRGAPPEAFLVLRARDEPTVAALERVRREILAWLLVGLALSLLAGYLLARVLAAPVTAMARTARAVQGGDLQARIPVGRHRDEFSALAHDLNRMLERLEALVSAQRRFTADAAHDLRTPLAVLRGEVDWALRRERPSQDYRETLERMRSDLRELSELAEDLLTLARLEGSGEVGRSEMAPVMLSEVLEWPLRTARGLAEQRGRTLQATCPPGVMVTADASLVSRALQNLLVNGLLHGGNTALSVTLTPTEVHFAVTDDGPGLPAHRWQEILLTRFARGDSQAGGSGLGIAIAREVARVHGGRLDYVGPPAAPSTFTLILPLREELPH